MINDFWTKSVFGLLIAISLAFSTAVASASNLSSPVVYQVSHIVHSQTPHSDADIESIRENNEFNRILICDVDLDKRFCSKQIKIKSKS
ncbi:hypothetical protein [Moellerella wisconsensis]|uniref:hypothetical protein n=1 Tax=Moellerella wisconsensis TaxID=158849 RepID=UPI00240FACE5|nr:hypothetical protein [Moellerella wisconsensis]WJW82976.1 hypothetical protein QU516_06025 [Moellerella wisconsensis]